MERTKTPYEIMKQEERITLYYFKTRLLNGKPTQHQTANYKRIGAIADRYIANIRKYVGYVIYSPDYSPAFADIPASIYAKQMKSNR